MNKRTCIECRFCRLGLEGGEGTLYYCTRTGEGLPTAVLGAQACEEFSPQSALELAPGRFVGGKKFTYLRSVPE